ncbi:hypothetical protein ACEPPN_001125 [Leptodophora sp. 'Broadleaf-Isolate-01']
MGDIYKRASITIASEAVGKCTKSYFEQANIDRGRAHYPISIPVCSGTHGLGLLSFQFVPGYEGDNHLNRRAWTLQEQILSPRLLVLNSEMLWGSIMWNFTRCAITFPSDRFPAISGLAREVYRHTDWAYVAGLWKEYIHLGLLWSTRDVASPAKEYVAPSWSWASLDIRGPVGDRAGMGAPSTWNSEFYEERRCRKQMSYSPTMILLDKLQAASSTCVGLYAARIYAVVR